jgi:hypothetical protein
LVEGGIVKRVLAFAACCAVLVIAGSAQATPRTYEFTGTLTQADQYSDPIPQWQFAPGQTFTGKLVYDPGAVAFSWDYIDQPDWKLTFHDTPLVDLSFTINLPGGGHYHYDVPTQGLTDDAFQYVAIGRGSAGWNGVSIRTQNYPVGWQSGPPSAPVPPSAYVGPYNPHMVDLDLVNYAWNNPDWAGLLSDTGPDVDLAKLYGKLIGPDLDTSFAVRFSDSYAWTGDVERLDAILYGRIDSLRLASTVPEPATWAFLTIGIAAAGARMRSRRRGAGQAA